MLDKTLSKYCRRKHNAAKHIDGETSISDMFVSIANISLMDLINIMKSINITSEDSKHVLKELKDDINSLTSNVIYRLKMGNLN